MYVCNCSVYIQKKKTATTTPQPKLGGSEDGSYGGCHGRFVFAAPRGTHTVTGAGTNTHKNDLYKF
jgi:hypothetical protein